jgi:serine protease
MAMRALVLCCVLFVIGCGGGGGSSGQAAPPPPPPGPPAPGALTGRVDVFLPVEESVLETEPNGTQLQAHYLGEMKNGRTVSVLGHVIAGADVDGALDSFSLLGTTRTRLDINLSFDAALSPDIFLGLWDFTVQQYVQVHQAQQGPIQTAMHVKGLCALVVFAFAGEANYVLTIEAHTAGLVQESGPNDLFYGGQFIGEVLIGDVATVLGHGQTGPDTFDSVTVVCPEAVNLDVAVGIPATGLPQAAEFDLLVHDLTGGDSPPPELAYFVWGASTAGLAKGSVSVPAGSLIQVFVYAFTGDANWSLVIRGLAPPPPQAAVSAIPTGRGRPQPPGPRAALPDFPPGPEFVPGQALVRMATGGCPPNGCRVVGAVPNTCSTVGFEMPQGLDDEEQRRFTVRTIACLKRRVDVEYAEPNFIRRALREPNDTYYNLQWHYGMINLPQAWDITVGDSSVIVAVIDTGTTAHPDLQGREIPGYDFISDPGMALDGNGLDADPTDPGDGGSIHFSSFHGTHVAGTIGASTDNGDGVAGVTWSGRIMHLRTLGFGGGTDADIANAVLYAAGLPNSSGTVPAQPADVINMSLGGAGFNQTMADAVANARAAGVVIFAASGNENTTAPSYPAAYDGVVSVGAVDFGGKRAPYSNYGSTLDIVAPGGDVARDDNADGYSDGVLSTWLDENEFPPFPVYYFHQGTSMACPHAAGVAALMLAVNPNLNPAEVEQILKAKAFDLGPAGIDPEYGSGLIDAHAAVVAAQVVGAPPLPTNLALSTAALAFDRTETTKRIRISNAGGGILHVEPPTVFLVPGETWLQATLVPFGGVSSDTSALDVTVDRTDLVDGVYFGRVYLESNGGAQLILVLMRVQAMAPAPPSIQILVRAINVADGTVAKQVVVNPATLDLTFRLDDLAAGEYRIEAGTDADGDGQFCEPGELCGAYPVLDFPAVVQLQAGEERGPFRFTVAPSGILPTSE